MYTINLRKSDKSIRLVNNSKNIILRQSKKNITLQQTGRPGPKGDKGDPGTGTNDYNDLINKPFIPDELSELADDATHRTVTDTEKSTWNAKQEALTPDVDYLTPSTASSTYESLLPVTPPNPDSKYLNGNKEWAEIAVGSGGGAANLYLSNLNSATSGYKRLSYIPDVSETTKTITANNNTVQGEKYLFDDAIDVEQINPGTWVKNFTRSVSSSALVSNFYVRIFMYTVGGVENDLFTIASTEINDTSLVTVENQTTQSLFNCNSTDRLGLQISFSTTRATNTTFSYIVGDGRSAFITTPLALRHDQLRDLNGDHEAQHMTSAERTAVGTIGGKLNIDQTTPQTTVGAFTFPQVVNTHETVKTASGFRRALKVGPQTLTNNDGAYIEFTSSSSDGFGAQIGGLREGAGGSGAIVIKTGMNSQAERFRVNDVGNIGIGTPTPNASAILDVTSTTKAFMPPRMTTAQRDAIPSPIAGMVIYNSTTNVLNFHNGTAWGAV